MFSFGTFFCAAVMSAGWMAEGYLLRGICGLLYMLVWTLAQYVPRADGRCHNETLINHGRDAE